MTADVIAFPPVGVVGSMWTVAAPVQRSRSLITGRRYVTRWGRERREAMVNISVLSKSRSGAGYSEMLIRHLDGGANLVRLSSYPINWHLDQGRLESVRSSHPLAWTEQGFVLDWEESAQPLYWFTGALLTGVVSGDKIGVSGLPPNTLICRPGDFVRAFVDLSDNDGLVAQAVTKVFSNEAGFASIPLFDTLPDGEYPRVNIGASDSRVFEAVEMPRSPQPLGQNWFYQWNFREVFADEVGGFNEVNPW